MQDRLEYLSRRGWMEFEYRTTSRTRMSKIKDYLFEWYDNRMTLLVNHSSLSPFLLKTKIGCKIRAKVGTIARWLLCG